MSDGKSERLKKMLRPLTGLTAVMSPRDTIQQADAARDRRDWQLATRLYREALDGDARLFPAWVQLGNCSKEAGDYRAAATAYERAIEIDPDDADVHLQMGHLMKLIGDPEGAIDSYQRSYEIDSNLDAWKEISSLEASSELLVEPDIKALRGAESVYFLEILDLLAFVQIHTRITGIQRVVLNLIRELLGGSVTEPATSFEFCVLQDAEPKILNKKSLNGLVRYLTDTNPQLDKLKGLVGKILRTARSIEIKANDVFIITGAYWIVEDYSVPLLKLKEKHVLIGTYVYDLIPITHPQWVAESTRNEVIQRAANVFLLSDFILTISQYVAQEVRSLFASELSCSKPVHAVPLAHELSEGIADALRVTPAHVAAVLESPFILCVCTIEGRKNHLLLYRIWAALIRKYGADAIPVLVLVGKWGWRIDEFHAKCSESNFLDGKIVVLSDVSDADLASLYRRSLFTVFPSFVEGWGLPVGESLAFGRYCVASHTSSIPEVGGDFVDYFDPHNFFDAYAKIERPLFESGFLRAKTERIGKEFRPRAWSDVAKRFMESTARALGEVSNEHGDLLSLQAGELLPISGDVLGADNLTSWRQKGRKFVCHEGWHPLEHWGRWSSVPAPEIKFKAGLSHAGRSVRVYLQVRIPPPASRDSIVVRDLVSGATTVRVLGSEPKWLVVESAVDQAGYVHLSTVRDPRAPQIESGRPLFIGLSGIGYHPTDDTIMNLRVIEQLLADANLLCTARFSATS